MIKKNKITVALMTILMASSLALAGCSASDVTEAVGTTIGQDRPADTGSAASEATQAQVTEVTSDENLSSGSGASSTSGLIDTSDLFTDRDLEQEADLTDAYYMTLEDGEDITISSEGVYVISGSASDASIIVEAADTDKVQIVLDGVSITNSDSPAIYVKSADKVFVTTTDSKNTLTVTGTFSADGETNTDAVIFSKEDLVLNGEGTITISSTGNGITCKDDLKVTGGSYNITSTEDGIEANDSISISDGTFAINSSKDAIHCENSDDTTVGSIYIQGGSFDIEASDDGIQATTILMIDGGDIDIKAAEGLEATYVQINDGTINIEASDDGINAAQKSTSVDVVIEVNGGDITVNMGSGDTDGFDANGNIYINGGTISVTGNSAFDWDGEAKLNGGTVTVNGEEITELTNQFGGAMGGFGGRMQGGMMQDGEMPQPPEGADGQMPQQPEDFEGQAPEGTDGQMMTPPQGGKGRMGGGKKGAFGGENTQSGTGSEATEGN